MSFIEKNLANNERILYTAKLHWSIYIRGISIIIAAFIVGYFGKNTQAVLALAGLLFLYGIINLIAAAMRASSSEFAVTNRRVMLKTGIAKRHFIELQLNRADGLTIDQSVLGRMMDFGSIIVSSNDSREVFTPVAAPYEFKRQINNAIEGSFAPLQNPAQM